MSVRERAEHLITLAEAATGEWFFHNGTVWIGDAATAEALKAYDESNGETDWPYEDAKSDEMQVSAGDFWREDDAAFIAAARSEAPWMARQLLEALNRIEQLEAVVAKAEPVLRHVSRGRRAAFIDVYPDATARAALGLLDSWLALNPKEADE